MVVPGTWVHEPAAGGGIAGPGQVVTPVHEQELAAKQANPHGTRIDGAGGIVRHFDVGQQLNLLAIHGDRRRMQQARQAPTRKLTLALLETILGQNDGRRVHHHHTCIAINDDPIVLTYQLAGKTRTHHRWNIHAAGHDGGV